MKIKEFVKEHKGKLILVGVACAAAFGGYSVCKYSRDRWLATEEGEALVKMFTNCVKHAEGATSAIGYRIEDGSLKLKDVGEVITENIGSFSEVAQNADVKGVLVFVKK